MYANNYQMRTNNVNFDNNNNNYISSLKQKNNIQNKTISGIYLNKRPNTTKHISQPAGKNRITIYNSSQNIISRTKPIINRRINTSM